MRKLNLIGLSAILAFTTSSAFALHDPQSESVGKGAEQTTVEATPAQTGLKATVGTWAEGSVADVRDGNRLGGIAYLQVDYLLPEAWKVGVLNRVGFNLSDPIQWAKLRLLAEKSGFVDTGDVGNKFTLRVEPRTTNAKFDKMGRIVETIARFDFTFPVEGILSMKLREEPKIQFNTKADQDLAYNGVEVGPVIVAGPLFFNPNLINYQEMNNAGNFDAGFGFNSVIEYGIIDDLAVSLWTEYRTPYTAGANFAATTEWSLELNYTF